LSKGILKSIKRKNKLYWRYLRNPTRENDSYYKRYKNKLNHSIKIAKSSHYASKLQNMKSDMKSTWKVLNEVINKKKSKPTISSFKTNDNTEISDPILIANKFCNYFTNMLV
jgi:predicted CopG family antitoxin